LRPGVRTKTNLFQRGFAKEADDAKVIAAAMAKPGVVLQRAVGSHAPFRQHAALPTVSSLDGNSQTDPAATTPAKARGAQKIDQKAERRAAMAFEKERGRRERQRRKEEAAEAKARAKRGAATDKAEKALQRAQCEHDAAAARIRQELEASQKRAQAEERRWEKARSRLETALRRAGD
jgi:colicin import membrane protein